MADFLVHQKLSLMKNNLPGIKNWSFLSLPIFNENGRKLVLLISGILSWVLSIVLLFLAHGTFLSVQLGTEYCWITILYLLTSMILILNTAQSLAPLMDENSVGRWIIAMYFVCGEFYSIVILITTIVKLIFH